MALSLHNWLYRGGFSPRLLVISLLSLALVLAAAVAGGLWYYQRGQALAAEELRRQAAQEVQQKRDRIRDFYLSALSGTGTEGFIRLYGEIALSRRPLELTGFRPGSFSCQAAGCSFSYLAAEGTVFNAQPLYFGGRVYPPSFSAESVEYSGVASGMGEGPQLLAFNRGEAPQAPSCDDMLSYLYGFNSVTEPSRRFTLEQLPQSAVSEDEASLPDNPGNHGLLAGKWQVTLDDSYAGVLSFWHGQPYAASFIFQSLAGEEGRIEISGTFVCKRQADS